MMSHKASAKTHVFNRIRERYGRVPTLAGIDRMRVALKTGNCFLCQDDGEVIRGIVPFENIYMTAVYHKRMDCMLTVGCPLIEKRK